MQNKIVLEILDEYDRLKMGQRLPEDYENLMDKLRFELHRSYEKDDLASKVERTPVLELERIFLAKDGRNFVSFIEGARYIERKLGLWD